MARSRGEFLVLVLVLTTSIHQAVAILDSYQLVALELFSPANGSFGSLEESYKALRIFQTLGNEKKADISVTTCKLVSKTLGSSASILKDLFYALKVNGILKCEIDEEVFEGIESRLQSIPNDGSLLLDFYYSIGSLALVKEQASQVDVILADADGIFQSIKALSQSDGRWRYSSNNPDSSTYAAGVAFEALAGVVALASPEINQSRIDTLGNHMVKLFDSIEIYDDGAFYFDEKIIDAREHHGPLSITASVVRGFTAFAGVSSESLNILGDKILGLAKFFLSVGIPGDAKDFFDLVDALACLESNRVSIPLVLSLPATVLSLTRNDQLKVRVNTPLGSNAPPLTVKLLQASSSSSKNSFIIKNQELKFDPENAVYFFDSLPKNIDLGNFVFVFEILLHNPEHEKIYATGGQIRVSILVTGVIKVDIAEIAILDSDLGNVETKRKLDLAGENAVSLSANHLQKLRLSFQLATPLGHAFKPHQAFLKLKHETKVEHIFVVGSSGKEFAIILDFLGLVEKLFYLSGRYDIQLTVGDAVMENSFLHALGHVELDLPEPPEKGQLPPPQSVDLYMRYRPKAEIAHIFRAPEKQPPEQLSHAFLGLTFLPFIIFLFGLLRLDVNLNNFPTSVVPATFAILFQLGLGAVLLLYVLFWWKLDLFTTLKILGFLGVFLLFVGHRILSHLASTSAKLKSA